MGLFDLEGQLSFYGAYHNNKANVLIHTIFVPTLVFTALVVAATTGSFFEVAGIPSFLQSLVSFNLGFLLLCVYVPYYLVLEPMAGGSFSLFMIGFWLTANFLYENYGAQAVQIAIGVHFVSWVFQFIGHGVFEGRKPALIDNLLQSFVLAPLFVWLHVLFALGYRPALEKRIQKQVDEKIAEYKAGQAKKSK